MPNHREEQLLSNFAKEDMVTVTSPFFNPPDPKPIPASVLASMKMVDFVGYASLPKELRGQRNVVKAGPGAAKRMGGKYARRESAPRFRSDKDRDKADIAAEMDEVCLGPRNLTDHRLSMECPNSTGRSRSNTPNSEWKTLTLSESICISFEPIPDVSFYNHTDFSGLETDILNSYTNALLQALHYTSPIRAVAKAHICVDCTKEHCLLCEAGFLFRMLEDAKGVNCQASNFSRAFSATPQASALGLMDDKERSTSPYGSLIQSFNRWLMSTFSAEAVVDGESFDIRPSGLENLSLAVPSAIEQVLGIETTTTNTCMNCGFVATRNTTLNTVDLSYPKKVSLIFVQC
jgi:PAB-dependent poly(A)-specific ribonuclease subunit 2